ncbi:MAG: hypothetical protein MUC93_10640 [Bacteroidales bacterium]|jgi:nitrite reductase/ring-hydroxylating ferredoxin subunit|nr:hypothetical protein [Bacteroidales bacterium]
MSTASKIRYFFILTVLTFLQASCDRNKNDVIPDSYVDFTLDMMDFLNIYGIVGSDTVDASDIRVDRGRLYAGGFDGNGIIIYYGGDGYYAYDRTCPHDYEVNGLSIKVNIDFTIALCPRCSTTYALSASGTPASGPGKYYLKNYRTSFYGRYLRVSNY